MWKCGWQSTSSPGAAAYMSSVGLYDMSSSGTMMAWQCALDEVAAAAVDGEQWVTQWHHFLLPSRGLLLLLLLLHLHLLPTSQAQCSNAISILPQHCSASTEMWLHCCAAFQLLKYKKGCLEGMFSNCNSNCNGALHSLHWIESQITLWQCAGYFALCWLVCNCVAWLVCNCVGLQLCCMVGLQLCRKERRAAQASLICNSSQGWSASFLSDADFSFSSSSSSPLSSSPSSPSSLSSLSSLLLSLYPGLKTTYRSCNLKHLDQLAPVGRRR